jgi:large subunit ribosomal protein L29
MNIEKIRNLGPDEMLHQQREAADQLFRLKFQLKMGQTTGIKKMRELRKDLARIKTIARERELGITTTAVGNATGAGASESASASPSTPPRQAASIETRKTAAKSKKSSHATAKKAMASKQASAGKKKAAAPKKKAAAKKSKAKK